MLDIVAKKAQKWEEELNKYDEMIYSASKWAIELATAKELSLNNEEDTEENLNATMLQLDRQVTEIENAQKELIQEIFHIEESDHKKRLMGLAISSPDFAGLDESALESIALKCPNIKSILYLHQIYISHVKLVVEKILGYIAHSNSESI